VLGLWRTVTVGSYGDCGWEAVHAALTVCGWSHPGGVLGVRQDARSWALANDDYVRSITGPHLTWVITTLIAPTDLNDEFNKDDCLHFWQDHDHSGTWFQWLDSLLLPGRWLDYPSLVCIAEVFDIAILVISAVDGVLAMYHIGHVFRKDGRVLPLVLVHSHWTFIQVRQGEYWPSSWLSIQASRPLPHTLLGGSMLR
jgi:hypothetical protein